MIVQQPNIKSRTKQSKQRFASLLQIAFLCLSFSHFKKKKKKERERERENSLRLIATPPQFLQRNSNTRHSESLIWLQVHELHDHNATIPKQFTESNSILNQKWTQAELSDRTVSCHNTKRALCILWARIQ